MEYIGNIRNIWGNSNTSLTNLNDTKIIEIGKALNSISEEINIDSDDDTMAPSLIVVGSQSSGKSSVLNGILSMDILPTGKSMVTRTPLNLDLIQTTSDMFAEFGEYKNCHWTSKKKIGLTNPLPTALEIEMIHKEIEFQTNQKAGNEMNISDKEINLKIYSPHVPNLNLIDLPGLTMVACTDKGQPADIKLKIRNLISKYAKVKKNIMLCVMPAREDIEADVALDMCKEHDKDGKRTIGILTKVDLMNKGNSISNYLKNNISKDLKLDYGYYAIKNRNKEEMKTKTIHEGITDETNFFKQHLQYKDSTLNQRCGIMNLSKKCSEILLNNIKQNIPSFLKKIKRLQVDNDKLLLSLGDPVPTDNNTRLSLMNNIINMINTNFINSIEKRGTEINCGRKLKDIFINYRQSINNIHPFTEKICNDEFLNNIISNCEGNHMTFSTPTIEVLENCLKDNKISPFDSLLPLSKKCVLDINNELTDLLDKILSDNFINRFSKLAQLLKQDIIKEILMKNQETTLKKLEELINIEKNYIWTDDERFINSLKTNDKKIDNTISLRILCSEYFNSVKYIMQHNIPKYIMLFLVKNSEERLQSLLFSKTQNKTYLDLLIEEPIQNEKRNKYNSYKIKLQDARTVLESNL